MNPARSATPGLQRRTWVVTAIVVLALGFSATPTPAHAAGAGTFYNTISTTDYTGGGDPFMTKNGSEYIYTQSQGAQITIWRSPTITGLGAAPSKVIFRQQDAGLTELWAPEANLINGQWYVYFAAIDNGHRTMHVIRSASADPWSDYTYVGNVMPSITAWAIDATVGYINNQLYMIWSGTPSQTPNGGFPQNLYIGRMDTPTHVATYPVMISSPGYSWEQTTGAVNEGPELLQRNGQTFLIYSADGSWTDAYKLGQLTLTGPDPLNAGSWAKKPIPVFQSAGDVHGPGHNSFTTSPDGTETWNIYHAAKYAGAGWNRSIRAQKVNWNSDGSPNLGTPVSTSIAQAVPSGENAGGVTFEAESGTLIHDSVNCKANASGGCIVGYIDYPDSSVTINVTAPSAGVYPIAVRYTNGSGGNAIATQSMSVNGQPETKVFYYPTEGWDNYANAFTSVRLNAGNNSVRLTHRDNTSAEIDSITRYPVLSGVLASYDPNAYYRIINRKAQRALSCYLGGTADGTNDILYDYISATDQQWQIVPTSGGYFRIMNRRSGKALSIENGGTANDSRVHIWPWLGGAYPDQEWTIQPGTPGHVQIINRASGRVLSSVNGEVANNTLMHIWDYLGNADDEDWEVVPV